MLGCLAQAGCIITSDDDDGGDTAQFDVTWSLTEGDAETAAACPGSTAQVVSQNAATQQQFIDLYDCSDGFNATDLLPLDDYDVWVSITDDAVATTFAKSFTQSASLVSDRQLVPVSFTFPVDGGFFQLAWALEDSAGSPVSCADLSSGGVEIDATLVGPNTLYADIFDCTTMIATTSKVPTGDYTLVVSVLDSSDLSIADSEARDELIRYGNDLNDLGIFVFTDL